MSKVRATGNGETATADSAGSCDELHPLLEAMLFASNEPVTLEELTEAIDHVSSTRVEESLASLSEVLESASRGVKIEKIAGGYRLVTKPDLASSLRALFRQRNRKRLTPATLDVLSIIAYAQPITAPEIQEIRGSDPSYALGVLHERRLVRVVGRKKVVGRPILHGTTREFLLHFGLDSLGDLPPVEAYGTHVVPAQQRLFPVDADTEVVLPEDAEPGEGAVPGERTLDADGIVAETREPDVSSGEESDMPLAAPVGASRDSVIVAEP